MHLLDLEPQFIRREIRACYVGAPGCPIVSSHTEHEFHVRVDAIADADGILFICPKCVGPSEGHGPTGHLVLCWRPRVPADIDPKPGRWEFEGTGLHDLTLRAGSSSILLTSGCQAHFWIEAGQVRM